MATPLITIYLLFVNVLVAVLFLIASIALVAGLTYLIRTREGSRPGG